MGRLPGVSSLFLAVILIGQVRGSPFFYWNQADCDEQNTGYTYGEPSYQETMRDMVDETIRAICDIVRVAARAAKQELSEIAKIFYRHYQSQPCTEEPSNGYPGETVGEIYITTSDPQYEVTSTPSDSMIEDKFGNENSSSNSTQSTLKTSPTTQIPSIGKGEHNNTDRPSSSVIYNYSTPAPLEKVDLTTIKFTPTTTKDPTTETTRVSEEILDLTSPSNV